MQSIFRPSRRGMPALRWQAPAVRSADVSVRTVLRACTLIGLMCIVATACGTQNSPSAQSGRHRSSGSTHVRAIGGPCTSANLDITLDLRSAGVAAGTSVIPIDLTNVSAKNCHLAGYAYVSFATSRRGAQVGAPSTADRAATARTLQLAAGKTAHLWLKMVQATNLPAAKCRPRAVAGLRLKLPGTVTPIFLAHKFRTCAKAIQGTDILTVEPFQAGRAHSGTAQ